VTTILAPAPPPATVAVPPPVTVTAPPPTPVLTATDQKFLADLRNMGHMDPGDNTAAVLADARYVCDTMTTGSYPSELPSRLQAVWPSIPQAQIA
jgi:hypothetical protein